MNTTQMYHKIAEDYRDDIDFLIIRLVTNVNITLSPNL